MYNQFGFSGMPAKIKNINLRLSHLNLKHFHVLHPFLLSTGNSEVLATGHQE